MEKYVIGIDYGTLSARSVLGSVSDGDVKASCEYIYPHGVMNESDICEGQVLPTTALAHPSDYIEALESTVGGVISSSGISPDCIVGLCIDATSCSMLPHLIDGTPLASLPEFINEPNAYIKLWKHHGAEKQGGRMTDVFADAELLDDGRTRIRASVCSSVGYVRTMDMRVEGTEVYLDFYRTFGLNQPLGAKHEYVVSIPDEVQRIHVWQYGEYRVLHERAADGSWERVK